MSNAAARRGRAAQMAEAGDWAAAPVPVADLPGSKVSALPLLLLLLFELLPPLCHDISHADVMFEVGVVIGELVESFKDISY